MFGRCLILVLLLLCFTACSGQTHESGKEVDAPHNTADQPTVSEQVSVPTASATLEDAQAAYKKGDYTQAYKEFKVLAAEGNAKAQYRLGTLYYLGWGVPQDYSEAAKWFYQSASKGHVEAQCFLGEMNHDGIGMPQNYTLAAEWYRKAAEQGHASAQGDLARMYDDGEGVPKDYAEAVKWYRKAAERGNKHVAYRLGLMSAWGQGVQQDYQEAMKWLRDAAESATESKEYGVAADAQYHVAVIYDQGLGVQQDRLEAAEWYRKAAEIGHPDAQHDLGSMYWTGEGVPKDYIQAYAWYNLAAAQGDENAKIGRELVAEKMTSFQISEAQRLSTEWKEKMPWFGKFSRTAYSSQDQGQREAKSTVPPAHADLVSAHAAAYNGDYATAYKAYKTLAEQGNAEAQFSLALMYEHAEGVPRDYAEAARWYRKAAEQGEPTAQLTLGEMYYLGKEGESESSLSKVSIPLAERDEYSRTSVPQDYTEAAKWFRKAAEQRDPIAQRELGLMYEHGKGVKQDFVQALKWLTLSAAHGDADARNFRDMLAKKMTPAQIAEAQRMAREWRPRGDRRE
jgi:hypothetical protein